MKIIDLLNKIANDEKLPEIIKVKGGTYYLCKGDQSGCCYFSEKQGFGGVKLVFDTSAMNEEVEILEEEKKIPEKLTNLALTHNNRILVDKINEIIDYLKSKGE